MTPLYVEGLGMVSAAGLTQPQSTASFIAGVNGFSEEVAPDVFTEMQTVAKVPADWRLRPSTAEWLLNLAVRAGHEAMEDAGAESSRTLLVCSPPETDREHPCWSEMSHNAFLSSLEQRLGGPFAKGSRLVDGGPAALIGCLPNAAAALRLGNVERVLVIGVDTLLGAGDVARFRASGRLLGQSAQGLVPAEGAGALVLSLHPGRGMAVRGVGLAEEPDPVGGARQSQGRGMIKALIAACAPDIRPESDINFVVSNFNGERYGALEALLFRARFYRTHREYMATAYPAMSFGEMGAAGGAIALVVAADAFHRGIAPGAHAMLEVSSENGLRAAAYLSGRGSKGYDQAG